MKTKGNLSFHKLPTSYDGLIHLHMPRPIHDAVSYDNTVEIIDALAGHKLNAAQEDYLELLADLVERYEAATLEPIPAVSGLDVLKFLMEQQEMSGDDLAKLLGIDRSLAFKILKGTRSLTAEHIKKLAAHFAITSDVFLG